MKSSPLLILIIVAAVAVPLWVWGQSKGHPEVKWQRPAPEPGSAVTRRIQRISENKGLGMHGVISGRVTFDDGTPAVGYHVGTRFRMHQTGAPGEGDAVTGPDGRYTIEGLAIQAFYVGVSNENFPYIVPAPIFEDLSIRSAATGVDFVLKLGPEITVRVHDAESKRPMEGILIQPRNNPAPTGEAFTTDSKGEAKFRIGTLDLELQLEDSDKKRAAEAAPGYFFYRQENLPMIADVTWDVLTYDHGAQPQESTFQGVVFDASGTPAAGVPVRMIRYGETSTNVADRDGKFSFKSKRILPFEDNPGGAVLLADKGDESASKILSAKESWGTIQLHLQKRQLASVSGLVVDDSGRPIPGCLITYSEVYTSSAVSGRSGGKTDATGHFHITGLRPLATYQFSIGTRYDGGELGNTAVPAHPEKGNYIHLQAEENKDLGTITVPLADGKVAGKIVDSSGNPVTKDVTVILKGAHTYIPNYPDKAGKFEFNAVPKEPLMLRVFVGSGGGFRTADDSPDLLLARVTKVGEQNVVLSVKMRKAQP